MLLYYLNLSSYFYVVSAIVSYLVFVLVAVMVKNNYIDIQIVPL
jgi:hypothetical protein